MPPGRDTDEAAHRVQVAAYRRMGAEKRLAIALAMCDAARELTRAGIRSRHPEYRDPEVSHALFRLVLGDATYRAAWPHHPLLAP